jgi:anti-sigma factor RsiW
MMEITRDVVTDLLTVYLAGEASADTRRLVERYLETDAELAAHVARARAHPLDLPATPAPPPSAEKQALDATRQLLKTRTSTLVVACLFTLLPFSFVFEGSHVTFVVLRDAPVIALAWWMTAAAMWGAHFWVRRRVRVSGL